MQFIKQNLFLIIVAAVVLVVGGIFLVLISQGADKIDQALESPRAIESTISRFSPAAFVKPQQIANLKQRQDELQKSVVEVRDLCSRWNSQNYKVLTVTQRVGGKATEVAAFPNFPDRGDLIQQFKNNYRDKLKEIEATLHAVTLLPQDLIQSEIRLRVDRAVLDAENEARIRDKTPTSAPATSPDVPPVRPVAPGLPMPGATPGGPGLPPNGGAHGTPAGGATNVKDDVANKAGFYAKESLKIRQAKTGKLYVAEGAMDNYWGNDITPTASLSQLWHSQLNLWVQRDVVAAINQTNDDAIAGSKDKEPSVLNSAVKKLLEIRVDKTYTIAGGATSGTTGGGSFAPPPGGGLQHPTGPMVPGSGMPPPGGIGMPTPGAGPTPGPGGSPGAGGSAASITQHTCTKDYDVVAYHFKVVIPARYIPVLEANLMRQNLHTVLSVQMQWPTPTAQPVSSGTGNTTGTVVLPEYYGPDALVEVTFECELLLLTTWERGTWDAAQKKYTVAPLMPREVMAWEIRDVNPAILREEDQLYTKDVPKEKK